MLKVVQRVHNHKMYSMSFHKGFLKLTLNLSQSHSYLLSMLPKYKFVRTIMRVMVLKVVHNCKIPTTSLTRFL